MKGSYLDKLSKVESLSMGSKLGRFLNNPFKYAFAIAFRGLIYPITGHELITTTTLFWGKKMTLAVPSATDIYLMQSKSHSSEIRLAKFLINCLSEGSCFLDIGAHYGYFTLLGSELVGKTGKVLSFEPSKKTFSVLKINTSKSENIQVFQNAVSDNIGTLTFYEFPSKYSEYNTRDPLQFNKEKWFQKYKPNQVSIKSTTIDQIIAENDFVPNIIKIDVEGGEYEVISGGLNFFNQHRPMVVMEYIESTRTNLSHKKAVELMRSIGYKSYIFSQKATLEEVNDIDNYLASENMDSENVVFKFTER
jgi:FkbM family methyltransferase